MLHPRAMHTAGGRYCIVDGYAKINLVLEVLERRVDGYHEVRGVLMPIALFDRVEIYESATDSCTVQVETDGVNIDEIGDAGDNLAVRAFKAAASHFGFRSGVAIRIHKRIPVGGGLAGGSADAAATLVGLNRLFDLGASREKLMALGSELGSDVPALLHGGVVRVGGRGERVGALTRSVTSSATRFCVIIVNPGVHVSTAEIYRKCAGRLTKSPRSYFNMTSAVIQGDADAAATALYNGLQPTVLEHSSVVRDAYNQLREAGALGVLVAGSGASVFGLVRDRLHGEAVQRRLSREMWSIVTHTLPDGVMVAHGPLEP